MYTGTSSYKQGAAGYRQVSPGFNKPGGSSAGPKALSFNGVDEYAVLSTPVAYHTNLTQYRLYCEFIMETNNDITFIGKSGSFNSYIRYLSGSSTFRVRYGSSTLSWTGFVIAPSTSIQTLEILREASGMHELILNSVSQGTLTNSVTTTDTVDVVGRASTTYSQFKLVQLLLEDAPTSGSALFNHAVSASNTTSNPPVVIDTVGGNNATGVNMDASNWVDT